MNSIGRDKTISYKKQSNQKYIKIKKYDASYTKLQENPDTEI